MVKPFAAMIHWRRTLLYLTSGTSQLAANGPLARISSGDLIDRQNGEQTIVSYSFA